MSNFRDVKNSHVFVTLLKNSFEFFHMCDKYVRTERIFHMCDKYVRILHTCDRFVRMWKSNESVISVKISNVFVTNVKNSCECFTDVTNTCESLTSVKDSHEFFTSVIRTHDMCDKFIKRSICNAFIFTAAYLPKHNTVLWKEKCWGDILLFIRRLGIGRIRRWVSRLNRNLFCPSVKHEKSGNVRQPFIHFPINVSLIWSQVLNYTAEIHFVPDQGWSIFCRFDGMRTIWIRIPEVAEYQWFHPSP